MERSAPENGTYDVLMPGHDIIVVGDPFRPGHIYVAPPDRHLLLAPNQMKVVRGPKENGHRPAVDALFRSAARAYSTRVVGVVLTGALDCGTAGLLAIRRRGGVCIVQDPNDAFCPDMPASVLQHLEVDHCVRLAGLGELLARVAQEPARSPRSPESPSMGLETQVLSMESDLQDLPPGQPSSFSCPSCGGVLNEVQDSGMFRFRCRTGHGFSPGGLQAEQEEALEAALWAALRALEDQSMLTRRLAGRARERGQELSARQFDERTVASEHQATLVREALRQRSLLGVAEEAPVDDRLVAESRE